MKEVTFGQYYPVESFVHKVDPRLKIVFLIAYITAIFLAKNFYGLAACAFVLVLTVAFSRVPILKVLRALRGIAVLILFTSVLNVFFYRGEGDPYFEWTVFAVYREGLIFSAFLVCRLVLLAMLSSMLTYTTTPVALCDGIESLLTPLKWIRFPVHAVSLIMSQALSMIPILSDETDRIKSAQMARGADFESGNPVKRVKAMIPILIPLLISAFRRAEELGEAMEARCYMGDKKRTKYKKLTFTWRDLIVFLLIAGLVTGVVLLRVYCGGVI